MGVTMCLRKFDIFLTSCIIFILCTVIKDSSAKPPVKIKGGFDATIEEFPSMVSLRYSSGYHACGGSLITNKHVLTAAHCIAFGYKPEDITVCMGYTSSECSDSDDLRVEKIKYHEKYKAGVLGKYPINDIGILTLERAVETGPTRRSIALPSRNTELGETAYLAGWGLNDDDKPFTSILQKTQMKISNCLTPPNMVKIPDTQICAFNSTKVGVALYDSGGPLIINHEIVGIISWSYKWGNPDVFTRVFSYLEWINHNTQ